MNTDLYNDSVVKRIFIKSIRSNPDDWFITGQGFDARNDKLGMIVSTFRPGRHEKVFIYFKGYKIEYSRGFFALEHFAHREISRLRDREEKLTRKKLHEKIREEQ